MPGKIFQLFLKGLRNEIYRIEIDEDATIEELRQKVIELSKVPDGDIILLCQSKQLRSRNEHGEVQHLEDYNIGDESNIFLVLRLLGGSDETEIITQPKLYDSEVQLTDKPDMFTMDDDEGGQRAEMPCGHAIGPESLTAYCRSILTAGRFEFRCPYKKDSSDPFCDALWEFFTVKRLAVLTGEELKEFEIKITENYLRKAVGIQECPRCQSYCERRNKKNIRVICPVCTNDKDGKLYEFCWSCLKTWLGSGIQECENANCTGQDPRLTIVKNCPTKQVVGVNSPAIRACPTCGLLIEHKSECKQMECPCGQKFCFICLKIADASGKYVCGYWNFKCDVAPIQTSFPGD